jgi:hypothetical protein
MPIDPASLIEEAPSSSSGMTRAAILPGRAPPHGGDEPDVHPEITPEDRERVRRIRAAARAASDDLRARFPFLARHQDAIGLGLLLGSAAVMVATAWAFAIGLSPAWATVPVIAFACSIAHEIEHDLIHKLYFPRRRAARGAMMALGWLMRPSTPNPWLRIRLHLKHHQLSGTPQDLEERMITNGERWGLGRLLMTADAFLAVVLRLSFARKPWSAVRLWLRATAAYFPMGFIYHALLATFVVAHGHLLVTGILGEARLPEPLVTVLPTVDFLAVVWILPNLLRTFCLHLVSSNVHYYGDVREGDVLRQTQVIDRAWFMPFQLFCFNFGATHVIHHFWVPETFYVRQLTAGRVRSALRENGVRWNDLGTFKRANRYSEVGGPAVTAPPG